MSNNIYEQAIADAKKLREVAEQNAKNAIIEAITPRVRELIDNELTNSYADETISESVDLDETSENNEDIILEESAILELAKEIAGTKTVNENDSILSFLNELDGCMEEEKIDEEDDSKQEVEESISINEENSKNKEDNMNLEELLNEIKMEIDLEVEDEEVEQALLEIIPTIKILEDEEDAEGELEMEELPEEGEKEEDAEGEMPELELPSLEDMPEDEVQEETYQINESILEKELKKLRDNRSSDSKNESSLNESRYRKEILKERRDNRLLRGKLEEYRGAVENLRDQLNEMNLFNAKLLYVNKLLQTKGLDASQKKNIIESIDNAESLREVKLVYKTLSESVNKKSTESLNETKIRKLASSSSRPTKSGGTLLNESSGQVDRWARLAGLK